MKNNAFFMVFCYFDCEKEQRGSDPIALKILYAEYKEALNKVCKYQKNVGYKDGTISNWKFDAID